MAILSTDEATTLENLVDYLTKAGVDVPMDEVVAKGLSRMHDTLGYDSEIKFLEDFRDAPVRVLLNAILVLDAAN